MEYGGVSRFFNTQSKDEEALEASFRLEDQISREREYTIICIWAVFP